YVPALELDDGQILTELPALMQYLADQKPEANMLAPTGTIDRIKIVSWLTFIGMELHRSFTPFFRPDTVEAWKQAARGQIERRLKYLNEELADRSYIGGEQYTVADPYLFTILNWSGHIGLDLAPWPNVASYRLRVGARPKVQEA